MLEWLSGFDREKVVGIVDVLVKLGVEEKIITKDVFDNYKESFEVVDGDVVEGGVKVLSDLKYSSGKVEVFDFVRHFRDRYNFIKEILEKRDLDNLSSLRRIGVNSGVYSVIVAVSGKRITKNKNLLLEVEDLTGSSVILVNRENRDLFARAKNLLLDDIVAFKVSGSSKMLFANDFVYPDASLENEKFAEVDEYVAFSGDFHIGSKMFLEKNLLKFVDWLNCKVGDERQRAIAGKVRYLFLAGDNIDGVGIYSGQEDFLNIKSCKKQYEKLVEILSKVREDIEIVMCPGQHDAVWVGEPQSVIPKKWAPGLREMKNLHLVQNPSLVEIGGGFKVLMYHGAGINRFIDELSDIRMKFGHSSPTRVVKEILKRRHLSPTHGLVDYLPCRDGDPMVIRTVPDIIVTGDQHRAEVDSYNNILMVAGSCWQSVTSFEEKIGVTPIPCRVPLFNLKTREIKIIDFSDDKIKWEDGEDLVCKLEVDDENSG